MIELGTEVPVLDAQHADGTYWVDVEGDIWAPSPFGWCVTRRAPFTITTQLASPSTLYGPYRAVLAPLQPDTPTP